MRNKRNNLLITQWFGGQYLLILLYLIYMSESPEFFSQTFYFYLVTVQTF